jgi:hypothetical protein
MQTSTAETTPSPVCDDHRAADHIGVSVDTIRRWRRLGTGPVYLKLGTGPKAPVRYRITDLDAWLDAHARTSTSGTLGNGVAA